MSDRLRLETPESLSQDKVTEGIASNISRAGQQSRTAQLQRNNAELQDLQKQVSALSKSAGPAKEGARKSAKFTAVSTQPSLNKTPAGSAQVVVPYPTYRDLSNGSATIDSVTYNGDPVYGLDQTCQPAGSGDAPGTGGGIRSGTTGGAITPTGASSTVTVGGRFAVRHGDSCRMNGGNNPGRYLSQAPASPNPAKSAEHTSNPPVQPETAAERGAVSRWWDRTKYETGEAVRHPVEGGKGAVKGIINAPFGILEGAARAQMQREALKLQMLSTLPGMGRLAESAEVLGKSADALRLPQLKMSNAAQSGGDTLATVAQLFAGGAGMVRGAAKGAAGLGRKAGQAAEGAADAARAGVNTAGDAAKGAARSADEGAQAGAQAAGKAEAAGDAKAVQSPGDGVVVAPRKVQLNGYDYEVDSLNRVTKAEGNLTLNRSQGRNTTAQRKAGGPDRLADDQGGHYVGRRFNGPMDDINHFAQNGNFNNGAYRTLENSWQRALDQGKTVRVEIVPSYTGSSLRPDSISVKQWINGVPQDLVRFGNNHGGTLK